MALELSRVQKLVQALADAKGPASRKAKVAHTLGLYLLHKCITALESSDYGLSLNYLYEAYRPAEMAQQV